MRVLKFVFWAAVLGAAVYLGWYGYQNWLSQGAAVTKQVGDKATAYVDSVASTTQNAAIAAVKGTLGDLVTVVGEQISNWGSSLSGATSSVSSSVPIPPPDSSPVSSADSVPAPTSSLFASPPPPATIVVGVNVPLSFSINSGQIYKVDWGDGTKDQGTSDQTQLPIIRHAWTAPGDYSVEVNVGNSVSSNTFSFPVRVYQ